MLKHLSLTVLSTVLFLIYISPTFGQVTGRGCNLGSTVATHYLGTALYNGNAGQFVRVYSSNSASSVPIITGNGYAGYRCGYINIYPAGTRYVAASNSNVAYNAANEITATYSTRCATASSFSANYVSGSGGEGTEVDYRYNDPAYYADADPSYSCAVQPSNLPVDDYMVFLLLPICTSGFLLVRKKLLLAQ